MSWHYAQGRSVAEFVLTDRRVIAVLTIAYVVTGLLFVRSDYTLHDEGLLTHYWASWARQDFVPVFFYQKVKPLLAAIYAPFTAAGIRATMAAHVIVASTAIPMIAATARSLGHQIPNLPAIVVAFSPIYLYGGSAGLSNVDGLVGVILVVYLLTAQRRPLLAGIVSGMLPWVRFELGIFSMVVAIFALAAKRDRLIMVGLPVFPLIYGFAGAVYHRDLLWLIHFPPSAPYDPTNPIWRSENIGLQYFLGPALALCPAAAVIFALRVARLQLVERMVLIFGVAATLTVQLFPIFKIGNFGAAPRYSVHVLPALALLLSRAVEPWWEGARERPSRLLVVFIAAAWMATRESDPTVAAGILIAYGLLVAIARYRPGTPAVMVVVALAVAAPILPVRFEVGRAITAAYLDPMVEWLEAHPGEAAGPIYSNSQLLAPFLENRGWAAGSIYFMTGVDMWKEGELLNQANGQFERIGRLARSDLYGRGVMAPFAPEDVPDGALFALRVDRRLPLVLPEAVWGPHLEVLAESPQFRIARFRSSAN